MSYRLEIKLNSANAPRYRFHIARATYVQDRAAYKDFGHRLAEAIAASDDHMLERLFVENPDLVETAWKAARPGSWFDGQFFECEHCGKLILRCDSVAVYNGHNFERWCTRCFEESAVVCSDCGDAVPIDNAHATYCGDPICGRCYRDGGYFTCAECCEIFHEDDYGGEGMCRHCYDDTYNGYSDDEDEDGLSEYHSADRDWCIHNSSPNFPFLNAPPMGLELEAYAENRADAVAALKGLSSTDEFPSQLILERDSSLDYAHGLEIITDPMGLAEWREYAPALLKTCRDNKIKAWDARNGMYGIHITIARKYLSPLQEARMMMFLCAEQNRDFVTGIAQRPNVYAASLPLGSLAKEEQKIENIGKLTRAKKIAGVGKYAPINFKPLLAEFRIFAATLNPVSFMKNFEFVSALVEWTSPMSATGNKWHCLDFIFWLMDNRPNARKDYPNLFAYLSQKELPVKGIGKMRNENWFSFHTKTKSAPQPETATAEE